MIVEWAVVEQNLDVTLIGEFGLLSFVPPEADVDYHSVQAQLRQVLKSTRRKETQQIALLLDLPFYKKMEFLMAIGAIRKNEALALEKFRKDRNRCFHGEI